MKSNEAVAKKLELLKHFVMQSIFSSTELLASEKHLIFLRRNRNFIWLIKILIVYISTL